MRCAVNSKERRRRVRAGAVGETARESWGSPPGWTARMHVGELRALASSEPPVGTVRAQNLCELDPLVAVPQTSMCMGVDPFTEKTGGPAREILISPCGKVNVVIIQRMGGIISPGRMISPEIPRIMNTVR